jgi:hypothetical protein
MKQPPENRWSSGGSHSLTCQASRHHACYSTASAMGCTTLLGVVPKWHSICAIFAANMLTWLSYILTSTGVKPRFINQDNHNHHGHWRHE